MTARRLTMEDYGRSITVEPAHAADPTTFDPGRWRDQGLRRTLIASGALLPLSDRPTLWLDERGKREALRACKAGEWGKKTLHVTPDYWELAPWHLRAIERRALRRAEHEARIRSAFENVKAWIHSDDGRALMTELAAR